MSFPNRGEIQSNHLKYMKTRPSMRATPCDLNCGDRKFRPRCSPNASGDRVRLAYQPGDLSRRDQCVLLRRRSGDRAVAIRLVLQWRQTGERNQRGSNLRQRHQFHVATEPRSVKKANSYQLGKDGVWEYWSDGVVGPPSPQYPVTSLLQHSIS